MPRDLLVYAKFEQFHKLKITLSEVEYFCSGVVVVEVVACVVSQSVTGTIIGIPRPVIYSEYVQIWQIFQLDNKEVSRNNG